jgi:enoyl-CoA hydratase/carnithine racemase
VLSRVVHRINRLDDPPRALEILLAAHDLDGPSAERYGFLNRLIADDRLDDEVEEIAERIARFDHDTIARTKAYVDQMTPPAKSELAAAPAPPGA